MTTSNTATPDRTDGTSISKYQDVEVGHWFRTPSGTYGPGLVSEVVDIEWNQALGGAVVYLRNDGDKTVHSAEFTAWRQGVRATLPPWAE
jgi:hypothetical protein